MTVNHTPPKSEGATLISTARAMEIAAYWQSPGSEGIGMARFASTGTVADALLEDIKRELRDGWQAFRATGLPAESIPEDLVQLEELDSYVAACTVPLWTVGSNHAGYLPDGDVHAFLSYADAVDAYSDALGEAPEALCGGECDCTDNETCEGCSMEAEVMAYLRDDVPITVNGKVFGGERELSIALRPEDKPLPTVFWVNRAEWLVSDYVDAQS
jgi:hypothetical protein